MSCFSPSTVGTLSHRCRPERRHYVWPEGLPRPLDGMGERWAGSSRHPLDWASLSSQLRLEGIMLGQEALKTCLVDSMDDLTGLLVVADALGQGETRCHDIEQTHGQERSYPSGGRKECDTGGHREERYTEGDDGLDEESGCLLGLDFKSGHVLILGADSRRNYPGLPSLCSGGRPAGPR